MYFIRFYNGQKDLPRTHRLGIIVTNFTPKSRLLRSLAIFHFYRVFFKTFLIANTATKVEPRPICINTIDGTHSSTLPNLCLYNYNQET